MSGGATLVVGPSWVGDMVMAQALFKLLKARQPSVSIDVLAPAWSLPVVGRMPEVRRGIAAETSHGELGLGKRRRIGMSLRGEYARAIVLPRSLKSALAPWFAKIPVRTGFRGETRFLLVNDMRRFDPDRLDQTVKRFVALGIDRGETLPAIPFPALAIDSSNQAAIMTALDIETSRPVAAFMPGAEYGPAKCWPLDEFARLAARLDGDGYDVWVLGSERDSPAGEAIATTSPARNLCGRTGLADVIDLLGYTTLAVSNDSGLMHIAAAVGTHVHAIYGSSSPAFTPPLTAQKTVHYLALDCSPCFERECPLEHLNCLRQISADDVYSTIS